MVVAGLYVQGDGVYSRMPGIDLWPIERDARGYAGPLPVVAHPPCERWGRFWSSDGSTSPGGDAGCFEAALRDVRLWGGVLEHPEGSHAFSRFDLPKPVLGSWQRSILCGGYVTAVAQRVYGHRARKMSWLYYAGRRPPPLLDWSDPGSGTVYLAQPGRCSRARPRKTCPCARCRELFGPEWIGQADYTRMRGAEVAATPRRFAELLVVMAARASTKKPPG